MDMKSHLKSRHVQPERYPLLSWDEDVATFPLWNLSGQLVGYQNYRPKADKLKHNDEKYGKYFTYVTKTTGHSENRQTVSLGVFGLETFNDNYNSNVIFLTEGIFKSIPFHNFGFRSLALLSNDPKHLKNFIYILSKQYKIYVVCDNDAAGDKLAKFGIPLYPYKNYKDIDEMPINIFKNWLKELKFI